MEQADGKLEEVISALKRHSLGPDEWCLVAQRALETIIKLDRERREFKHMYEEHAYSLRAVLGKVGRLKEVLPPDVTVNF